ncbi:PhzF family phenazine biosynthesis protein [Actinoplanes sp. TBRC 11911]|uniref:PhzF family phenazine biosynthesis protein n=1 Tax=Actinoplanes sp. TBRC 11911 TaxID=2729386 RepID=UPI00145DB8CC|nr:PhzF family phenazine biosynthesis protein [Actinoplanes sp. TBRC 11911]NMO54785.1 PhzF family phenazine biosynthesis protein [Actinoplanes sp. TBRC 11911]
MTMVPFALVDVFSDRPLAGNPLAVVPDADHLDDAVMARIAREFNQSETTFLLTPTMDGAAHRLRSFTPAGVEVFGAGHNALGAWWWLAGNGRLDRLGVWHQQLGDVVLPVDVAADRVAMRQEPARFGSTVPLVPLAAALGVDVVAAPAPQVVGTGAAHLLVGVRDRATVDAAAPDTAALRALLLAAGGEGCYVYAVERGEVTAYARFFNPVAGIVEDPATGTAAGPLAGLLHRHGLAGETSVILQGHRLGRPSRLEVRLDGATPVLSGRAVVSATGTLRLA